MAIKPISCICNKCKHVLDCEYYEETVSPIISVVAANNYTVSDPFIRSLDEALENFICEYFSKEN